MSNLYKEIHGLARHGVVGQLRFLAHTKLFDFLRATIKPIHATVAAVVLIAVCSSATKIRGGNWDEMTASQSCDQGRNAGFGWTIKVPRRVFEKCAKEGRTKIRFLPRGHPQAYVGLGDFLSHQFWSAVIFTTRWLGFGMVFLAGTLWLFGNHKRRDTSDDVSDPDAAGDRQRSPRPWVPDDHLLNPDPRYIEAKSERPTFGRKRVI